MSLENFSYLKRSFIRIKGRDSLSFLNSIVTNNVNKVTTSSGIYTLLLNPQGKFLFEMFITQISTEDYRIEVANCERDNLYQKLKMYKFRLEVTIEKEEDINVAVAWGPEILSKFQLAKEGDVKIDQDQIIMVDPRFYKLGIRIYYQSPPTRSFQEGNYEEHRINLGISEGNKDLIKDKSFPLHFGLHKLNAIDFKKGCYIGQEVISRTVYKGVIRKKVFIITSKEILQTNQELFYESNNKILICSTYSNKAIALVNFEDDDNLDQALFSSFEGRIHFVRPEWE